MSFFESAVLFSQTHALWYITPFYMVIGFYILLVLGWFFSTDYYDRIYDAWDSDEDDFYLLHICCIVLIIFIVLTLLVSGLSGSGTLLLSTAMWIMIVLPIVCNYLLKLRKYLRKKRGKPM